MQSQDLHQRVCVERREMLRGCVDMQLPCQFLSAPAGLSAAVDVLLFTQFGIHRILDLSKF